MGDNVKDVSSCIHLQSHLVGPVGVSLSVLCLNKQYKRAHTHTHIYVYKKPINCGPTVVHRHLFDSVVDPPHQVQERQKKSHNRHYLALHQVKIKSKSFCCLFWQSLITILGATFQPTMKLSGQFSQHQVSIDIQP